MAAAAQDETAGLLAVLAESLGWSEAELWVADVDGLRPASGSAWPPHAPAALAARAIETGRPTWNGAALGVPLTADGRRVGVLVLLSDAPRERREADETRALAAAAKLADFVERQLIVEDASRAVARFASVAEASGALAGARLDIASTFDAVAPVILRELGDLAILRLLTPDQKWLEVVAEHHRQDFPIDRVASLLRALPADLGRLPDAMIDLRAFGTEPGPGSNWPAGYEAAGVRAAAVAPLRYEGRSLGLFSVARRGAPYRSDEIALLQELADRTAVAIANARLYEAERAARAAAERALVEQAKLARSNRDLETFARAAAHDLREPLRAIRTFATFLEADLAEKLEPQEAEYLTLIQDATWRMDRLVSGLLDLARVDARGAPFTRFRLADAVRHALDALGPAIADAGAAVVVRELPEAEGDAAQVSQIFQNLIANALKFRAETPPRVEISAQRIEGAWEVHVADNGIGIPAHEAEHIFELFRRLHPESTYPGAGMGLAICRRIVERHGGVIKAEPRAGGGTEVWFTLPDR